MNKKSYIYPFILSGGSGKRLWPLSRSLYPKQFVSIEDEYSLFQETLLRLGDNIYKKVSVVCNQDHRFMVRDQAKSVKTLLSSIILEPVGRNTAASALIAALSVNKEDLILLLPADHIIKNNKNFNNSIKKGVEAAQRGNIVLFGVKPSRPETNYGYITIDKKINGKNYQIKKFNEKPSISEVKKLIKSKNVFWNCGIFLFKSQTLIEQAKKYCPKILSYAERALKNKNINDNFTYLHKDIFKKIKNISLDYALIQKTNKLIMTELTSTWSDMGTWENIWFNNKKDKNNNLIKGDNYNEECTNSLIISDKQFTLTSGLKDFVVVSISNALLVIPKYKLGNLSKIIDKLSKKENEITKNSLKSYRPWGTYEVLKIKDNYQVKEIIVNPGSSISLQKHKKRSEHWVVIEGKATVTKGRKVFDLMKGESMDISIGEIHRLENKTKKNVKIIEIQTGTYLGEDDIIRYKDKYKR